MLHDAVVHVIDDDEAVREALAFMLMTAGYAVRVHESATAFLAIVDTVQSGCIVTDIRMPGMSGLELQQELKERRINLPLIVMTGHGDIPLSVKAMRAGAVDFIEKPFDNDVLLAAIEIAINRLADISNQAEQIAGIEHRLASLTPREHEVLEGMLLGKANKLIGKDLNISTRTVEAHRAKLMSKMAAKSLAELVRLNLMVQGRHIK